MTKKTIKNTFMEGAKRTTKNMVEEMYLEMLEVVIPTLTDRQLKERYNNPMSEKESEFVKRELKKRNSPLWRAINESNS